MDEAQRQHHNCIKDLARKRRAELGAAPLVIRKGSQEEQQPPEEATEKDSPPSS